MRDISDPNEILFTAEKGYADAEIFEQISSSLVVPYYTEEKDFDSPSTSIPAFNFKRAAGYSEEALTNPEVPQSCLPEALN